MKLHRCGNFEEEMPDCGNDQFVCFLWDKVPNWTAAPFI